MIIFFIIILAILVFVLLRFFSSDKDTPPVSDDLSPLSLDTPINKTVLTMPTRHITTNDEYIAMDFEDQHIQKIDHTDDRIDYCLDDLTGDAKKDAAAYQKALKLCAEYSEWCFAYGEAGRAFYEYHVSKIEDDVKKRYEKFLCDCKKADSLSSSYGFPVPYDEVDHIHSDDTWELSSYYYDFHNKEIDKALNSIVALSSDLVDNPTVNLKRYEKIALKCSDFKTACYSTIGGKAYYDYRGHDICDTVLAQRDDYIKNYSAHEAEYKKKQAHNRELASIKKSVISILKSNDGYCSRVDIVKALSDHSKDDVLSVVDSGSKSGIFELSKNGNRIFVKLIEHS